MASNQAADPILLSLLRRNSDSGEIDYRRVAVATVAGYLILRLLQASPVGDMNGSVTC
jgi:hypothetical protein